MSGLPRVSRSAAPRAASRCPAEGAVGSDGAHVDHDLRFFLFIISFLEGLATPNLQHDDTHRSYDFNGHTLALSMVSSGLNEDHGRAAEWYGSAGV